MLRDIARSWIPPVSQNDTTRAQSRGSCQPQETCLQLTCVSAYVQITQFRAATGSRDRTGYWAASAHLAAEQQVLHQPVFRSRSTAWKQVLGLERVVSLACYAIHRSSDRACQECFEPDQTIFRTGACLPPASLPRFLSTAGSGHFVYPSHSPSQDRNPCGL